jgi:hypothetical protein
MAGKRVARPANRRRRTMRVIGALVAVVVVLGAAYGLIRANRSDDDGTAASSPGATTSASPTPTPSTPSPTPTPTGTASGGATSSQPSGKSAQSLRACVAQLSAADKVVSAAADGVGDWAAHVQARTDMFAGRISPEDMKATWKRTRLAGPGDQKRFHAALDHYQTASACQRLDHVAPAQRKVASGCAVRAKDADRAVAAAKAAMGDWKSHLGHMAAYAAGDMTESEAQTMWVAAWRHAPHNISAYHDAREKLAQAPACLPVH